MKSKAQHDSNSTSSTMMSSKYYTEDMAAKMEEIFNSLDLDELNGSPLNARKMSQQELQDTARIKIQVEDEEVDMDNDGDQVDEGPTVKLRLLDWNNDDMNEEFILEIFCNANNNFLPDICLFQNIKMRDEISNHLTKFNFIYQHNDSFKNRSIESIFLSQRCFSKYEIITRDNIFLKTSDPAAFHRLNARFQALTLVKKRYVEFTNFFRIYVGKFMEHMILAQLALEESKTRRILEEGSEIAILVASFQNIAKAKSSNIELTQQEFFLLAINFLCDFAESLNVSLLLGCCANFNILDNVCASWYPSGFKIVSKGKDKHRDVAVDFFGYFQPKSLAYDLRISKMCRFGHRSKHTPIYRNPHPIQLCDVTIKAKTDLLLPKQKSFASVTERPE